MLEVRGRRSEVGERKVGGVLGCGNWKAVNGTEIFFLDCLKELIFSREHVFLKCFAENIEQVLKIFLALSNIKNWLKISDKEIGYYR